MSKYHAVKVEADGYTFDSKLEANRWHELKLALRDGCITNLRVHPKYPVVVNGVKICTYIADFVYHDKRTDQAVVEDCKGMLTPVYRLKKKLLKATLGIEITEITNQVRVPSGRFLRGRGLERAT